MDDGLLSATLNMESAAWRSTVTWFEVAPSSAGLLPAVGDAMVAEGVKLADFEPLGTKPIGAWTVTVNAVVAPLLMLPMLQVRVVAVLVAHPPEAVVETKRYPLG